MPDTPHIVSDVMTFPVVAVRRDTRFKDIVRAMTDGCQRRAGAVASCWGIRADGLSR